jgi:antitoxin VapB
MARRASKTGVGKLFFNGRSQAVRLPLDFRFHGDSVRLRRVGKGVLLEPMTTDVREWFAELDRLVSGPFMEDEQTRNQPAAPKRDVFE